MKTNLEKFQLAKLQPLKEKIHSMHYNMDVRSFDLVIQIQTVYVSFFLKKAIHVEDFGWSCVVYI